MLSVFQTNHFDFVIESSISKNGAGKKRVAAMDALSIDIEPSSRGTIQLFELSMNYVFCLLYTELVNKSIFFLKSVQNNNQVQCVSKHTAMVSTVFSVSLTFSMKQFDLLWSALYSSFLFMFLSFPIKV